MVYVVDLKKPHSTYLMSVTAGGSYVTQYNKRALLFN